MQIIFVSSVADGGSGQSQRQLARRLASRGHRVEILAAARESRLVRPLYERQVDLTTRLRGHWGRPALLAAQRPFGSRIAREVTPDFATWRCVVPENGFRTLRRRLEPDVVVASSIDRVSWRRLRAQLVADGIPSVLYIREASGLGHLTVSSAPPDLLLANAESHASNAHDLGFDCQVVPSVVELRHSEVTRERSSVLLVNPIELLGGDRVWPLARARPDIPFVIQESGLHTDEERSALRDAVRRHPNVSIRPFQANAAAIFQDARVLLVPHRVDNRPRVVLEAQANGIPVIATDYPGLSESVGDGGVLVEDVDDPEPWTRALGRVWDDPARYAALVAAARAHAARPEVDPGSIAVRFEQLLERLIDDRPAAQTR